jgi:RNA polymerase sigma-70 factor (ECF subfamily)
MANSRPAEVVQSTEREERFLQLANGQLHSSYRLARAILRDPTEAEDATHDAFVRAWQKWSTLRDPQRFQQWFERIVVNTCRDRLRSPRWKVKDISNEVALAPGDDFARAHDREVLAGALATLTPEQRVVVALRYYRDMSVDEIASRLEITAGTVQSRLHYALKRLHAVIDAADGKGTLR